MIANYGYKDGSGEFFITIDTDKCIDCGDRGCIDACPQHVFAIIVDDYDDEVCEVKEEFRNRIRYVCDPCKGKGAELPCLLACKPGALSFSW